MAARPKNLPPTIQVLYALWKVQLYNLTIENNIASKYKYVKLEHTEETGNPVYILNMLTVKIIWAFRTSLDPTNDEISIKPNYGIHYNSKRWFD